MPIIFRLKKGSGKTFSEKAITAMMAELGVTGAPDAVLNPISSWIFGPESRLGMLRRDRDTSS